MKQPLNRREFLKMLGLLPLITMPASRRILQGNPSSPNVLFLVFDTLSARHISLYGYPRETMPNLARFAERATIFHRHYSAGSFTTSGTASLLTGLYPSTHRALQAYATVASTHRPNNLFRLFHQAGYHTLSFSQNLLVNILVDDFLKWINQYVPADAFALASKEFSDDFLSRDYGIAAQAERTYLSPLGQYPNSLFLSLFSKYLGQRNASSLNKEFRQDFPRGLPQNHDLFYILEDLIDWVIGYFPTMPQPYFAYLHIMPPHDPYNPRREFIGRFADQPANNPEKPLHFFTDGRDQRFLDNKREQYDEYIAYVDSEFGRLIASLEESGALDNTWVIFTSDHGELFERGVYRHITPVLYEGIVRVPLLIRSPGQSVRVDVQTLTSSVDILPTLLSQLGLPLLSGLDGRVLPPWGIPDPQRVIFAMDAKSNPKRGPLDHGTIAVFQGDSKLVHYFGYDGFESEFEYYDLSADPEELNNRYRVEDALIRKLASLIQLRRQ